MFSPPVARSVQSTDSVSRQITGCWPDVSFGGRGGIRTHGTLAGTPVFKTGALNHSATLPAQQSQSISVGRHRTQCERGPNLDPIAFLQSTSREILPQRRRYRRVGSPFVLRLRFLLALRPDHKTAMALRSRAISPGRPRSLMIRPMAS